LAALRRLIDLQAGSIWRDLAGELAAVHGLVLDVGCGAQPYRPLLGPSARYVGIDTADAKADFGYEIPDTLYFDGDSWPVGSESANVVLCTETLEHVLEPSKLLAEAHRTLRRGGRLLLTVPFAARWHFVPNDYWRFTPSSLRHLLETAGFTDVAVYARGNAFTVACYKTIALVLPYLFPQRGGAGARAAQLLALLAVPFVVCLALAARVSLLGKGGDDCLGYTVTAVRP
jgi:SAM-dependent methyltransferase